MKQIVKILVGVVLLLVIGGVIVFGMIEPGPQDIQTSETAIKEEKNTFTARDGKVFTEYKQYDPKWADEKYWGKNMERKGCGITAMAIVISGYGEKDTPLDLQKKYYPVMDYEKMSQELMENYNIHSSGFYYDQDSLSEEKILAHLKNSDPMIVCAWAENGANRWTKASHYLVLLDADDEGNIYVANPGGSDYGPNKNGWYKASEVVPYLAKALYLTGR